MGGETKGKRQTKWRSRRRIERWIDCLTIVDHKRGRQVHDLGVENLVEEGLDFWCFQERGGISSPGETIIVVKESDERRPGPGQGCLV